MVNPPAFTLLFTFIAILPSKILSLNILLGFHIGMAEGGKTFHETLGVALVLSGRAAGLRSRILLNNYDRCIPSQQLVAVEAHDGAPFPALLPIGSVLKLSDAACRPTGSRGIPCPAGCLVVSVALGLVVTNIKLQVYWI
jgi:hypothetical protein